MQMTDSEVKTDVLQAADQKKQVTICAQVNGVSPDKIREILKAQGVDLRSLKGKVAKKNIHGVKHKPHKKPANAEKNPANASSEGITVAQACAALIARVAELKRQRKAIDEELEGIEEQIGRVSDNIAEAMLNESTDT
jgi:DNA-binding transcriptional MerR regulator